MSALPPLTAGAFKARRYWIFEWGLGYPTGYPNGRALRSFAYLRRCTVRGSLRAICGVVRLPGRGSLRTICVAFRCLRRGSLVGVCVCHMVVCANGNTRLKLHYV